MNRKEKITVIYEYFQRAGRDYTIKQLERKSDHFIDSALLLIENDEENELDEQVASI
ncbi:hypothetical protein [Lacticaseibacillus hegangensis]|uniref:Uncharacterized protein n=1 Tax=Lacticaseibacillus hegangensis TaxID=2486010 RepID=A0ABW4CXA5_9LACO|nr:hypothetical protein [Lacticaseibacillus hegangensis]